jgi:hypothetical protein
MTSFFKLLTTDAIGLAKRLTAAVLLFVPLGGPGAFAAPILGSATRTAAFTSTSTAAVTVPLRDNGTKSLQFATTVANQTVGIMYNAECAVVAARGTWLSVKILVDGIEAEPSAGTDFSLCSAIDTDGQSWASAVRHSVLKVPLAGNHTVKISARLIGGSGAWALDDSSLVVQPALAAFATREDAFQSAATDTSLVELPLKQNGAKVLNFSTGAPNERLKITYNAECVAVQGEAGNRNLLTRIDVAGFSSSVDILCNSVDTTGETWAGAARQLVVTIPAAGSHTAKVLGALNLGLGTWRVDDSSLVVTGQILAAAVNTDGLLIKGTAEVAVPIKSGGGTTLQFTTTKNNQLVKLTYNATCRIGGARGNWLGIRIEVDGVEAAPASGYDFALCSSLAQDRDNYASGFRQSVISIPSTGTHKVRVFARMSADVPTGADLYSASLVVE